MHPVKNQRPLGADKPAGAAGQLVEIVPVQGKLKVRLKQLISYQLFIVRAGRTADRIAKPDTAPLDPGAVRQKMETQRQAQYLFYQQTMLNDSGMAFISPSFSVMRIVR